MLVFGSTVGVSRACLSNFTVDKIQPCTHDRDGNCGFWIHECSTCENKAGDVLVAVRKLNITQRDFVKTTPTTIR